ncbi:MAG: hypothetical protein JEY79_14195 [Pseudodesulfovibrio sp.]|nr:hypothetical protein [Pseudodesulfovibrio sp.]
MLEDKLKSSKQNSNNVVLILLASIVVLLVLGGLLTAEFIFNPDSHQGSAHGSEELQQDALGLEAQPKPSKAMDDSLKKGAEQTQTSSAQVRPVYPDNGRLESTEEERKAFKSTLLEYESTIKALVESPEFTAWDASSQKRFLQMKDQIMGDVGAGEYARARDELAELIRQATKVISERDAAVEEGIQQTRIALKENAPQKALAHFSRAQELAPHLPEVLELEPRVAILPQVVELLDQAHLAQVQGDTKSELVAWKEIAKIDPTRSEAKDRIIMIQDRLFQQTLSVHLQKTMAAIEVRQPDAAQKSLDKARKMAPKLDEVALLQREIDTLAKELRYNEFINQARAYEVKDDWSRVLSSYNDAATINRSSAEVANGIKRAQAVLGIRAAINEKLGTPYRLSTKIGEKQARELLQNVRGVFEISPSMVVLAQKLEGLLQIYTTPVMVRITSDGETFVQVKGVGKVGKVTEKNIRIRPGRYTFEGNRDGFVSKATTVDIPPSGKPMVVNVVCENAI